MAAGTVIVRGHRELVRDLRNLEKRVAKETRDGLKEAAEPVRQEWSSLMAPIDARTAGGYRTKVRTRGVAVEQRLGRTTGQHPDFGRLQMRRGVSALSRKTNEVVKGMEKVLDKLADRNGF